MSPRHDNSRWTWKCALAWLDHDDLIMFNSLTTHSGPLHTFMVRPDSTRLDSTRQAIRYSGPHFMAPVFHSSVCCCRCLTTNMLFNANQLNWNDCILPGQIIVMVLLYHNCTFFCCCRHYWTSRAYTRRSGEKRDTIARIKDAITAASQSRQKGTKSADREK